jgi:hypothetical protein
VSNEGRLSAARQPHDAEYFAPLDGERDVRDTDDGLVLLQHLRLGQPIAPHAFDDLHGSVTENLPDTFDLNDRIVQILDLLY